MLSRCSLAVCFLGLICLSVNVQAQQGKHLHRAKFSDGVKQERLNIAKSKVNQ